MCFFLMVVRLCDGFCLCFDPYRYPDSTMMSPDVSKAQQRLAKVQRWGSFVQGRSADDDVSQCRNHKVTLG